MRATAGFYFTDAPNTNFTPLNYVMGLVMVRAVGPLAEEFTRSAPSDFLLSLTNPMLLVICAKTSAASQSTVTLSDFS
jgi:hypothetical protein